MGSSRTEVDVPSDQLDSSLASIWAFTQQPVLLCIDVSKASFMSCSRLSHSRPRDHRPTETPRRSPVRKATAPNRGLVRILMPRGGRAKKRSLKGFRDIPGPSYLREYTNGFTRTTILIDVAWDAREARTPSGRPPGSKSLASWHYVCGQL